MDDIKGVFVYINKATCDEGKVIKIGITNNLEKRLNEFNNGLRYRARYFGIVKNVRFEKHFSKRVKNREDAKEIEKRFKKVSGRLLIKEFGSEVFLMSARSAVKSLSSILSEMRYDQD